MYETSEKTTMLKLFYKFYLKKKQQFCILFSSRKITPITLFLDTLYFFSCCVCAIFLYMYILLGLCWSLCILYLYLGEILMLGALFIGGLNLFVSVLKIFFPVMYLESTISYAGVSGVVEKYCWVLFLVCYALLSFCFSVLDWEQLFKCRVLWYFINTEVILVSDEITVSFGFSNSTTIAPYVDPADREISDFVAKAVTQYTQPIPISSGKKDLSLLAQKYTAQLNSSAPSVIPMFDKKNGSPTKLAIASVLFSGIASGQSIYGNTDNLLSVLQQADPFFSMEERFVTVEELMSTEFYLLKRNIFPGALSADYYKNQILKVGEAVFDNMAKPHPQVATICYSPKYKVYLLFLNGITTTPDIPNDFVQGLCCSRNALLNVGVLDLLINNNSVNNKDSYVMPMTKLFVYTEVDFKEKANLLFADARTICTRVPVATPTELHFYKSVVFPVFSKLGLVSSVESLQVAQATGVQSRELMAQFSAQITEQRCFDSVVEKYTDLKSVFPASRVDAFASVKQVLLSNPAIAPCYSQFNYPGPSGVMFPLKIINTLYKQYSIIPMLARRFIL